MKTILGSVALVLLGGVLLSTAGCKTTCGKDEQSGASGCTSKSLTEFKGTQESKSFAYAAGDSLTIETVYGVVNVEQGTADQVSVTFDPFDFEGYDEKDIATRQMGSPANGGNLVLEAGTGSVKASRSGDTTNGLGATITVSLPSNFSGTLTIINHGDGPVQHFDTNVDYVGQAVALNVTGEAGLGDCKIQGAPSVVNTKVDCAKEVDVYDVSDNVTITSREGLPFDDVAAVALRLSSISDTASGGKIHSGDGPVDITFPSGANFSVQASAPNGEVVEGTVPAACVLDTAAATAKTVTCGSGGANYEVSTDGVNDSVFAAGRVILHF